MGGLLQEKTKNYLRKKYKKFVTTILPWLNSISFLMNPLVILAGYKKGRIERGAVKKKLTVESGIWYGESIAGKFQQAGLTARFTGGCSAFHGGFFVSVAWLLLIWAAMLGGFGPAAPVTALSTRHGAPFLFDSEKGCKQIFSQEERLCPFNSFLSPLSMFGFLGRCPMQLKSFLTEEQIRNDNDALFLVCHPLSKLKMVSTIIENEDTKKHPFKTFRSGEVMALGAIVDAAADEIEYLVNIAQEQFNKIDLRLSALERKI